VESRSRVSELLITYPEVIVGVGFKPAPSGYPPFDFARDMLSGYDGEEWQLWFHHTSAPTKLSLNCSNTTRKLC
jgi:hypothetical protein